MDNINEIQKMKFIYNAIQNGWEVKRIDNNNIEFKKDKNNYNILNLNLDNFVIDNFNKDNFK